MKLRIRIPRGSLPPWVPVDEPDTPFYARLHRGIIIAAAIVLLPALIAAFFVDAIPWRGLGGACYGFVLILVFTHHAVRPGHRGSGW